jgi:D5 N terminal like/Family of unknown function (DUF5906)
MKNSLLFLKAQETKATVGNLKHITTRTGKASIFKRYALKLEKTLVALDLDYTQGKSLANKILNLKNTLKNKTFIYKLFINNLSLNKCNILNQTPKLYRMESSISERNSLHDINLNSLQKRNLTTKVDTPFRSSSLHNNSTMSYSTKASNLDSLDKIKPKKPILVELAKNLIKNKLQNFKFDLNTSDWFLYDERVGAWYRLAKQVMEQKIFIILLEKDLGEKLTPQFSTTVKTTLEMLMGVDFYLNNTKNKIAKLVPFKNGVLDLNTIKLLNHDPDYYFTYSLNIDYNPDAKISKSILDFLKSISNNNLHTIKILRSFIQCLLLKDNQFQVAIYLYGPGGTGKSTFEKLLTSLVGNKNTTVLNLQDLNKTFAISKVVDKSLLLFSDVAGYTGDPSKLRLLISGDLINAEIKYRDSFDIQPSCLVVLSSNIL